jgi:hypothetical protein
MGLHWENGEKTEILSVKIILFQHQANTNLEEINKKSNIIICRLSLYALISLFSNN